MTRPPLPPAELTEQQQRDADFYGWKMELRIFRPVRTDDLKPAALPWVGKPVHVRSWHENVACRDRYPDDERVGLVDEFGLDVPESELICEAVPPAQAELLPEDTIRRAIQATRCHGCGHPVEAIADGWYHCPACGRAANVYNKPYINYETRAEPPPIGNDRP